MTHALISTKLVTSMISVTGADTHFSDTGIFKMFLWRVYMQKLQSPVDLRNYCTVEEMHHCILSGKWFQKCYLIADGFNAEVTLIHKGRKKVNGRGRAVLFGDVYKCVTVLVNDKTDICNCHAAADKLLQAGSREV